MTPELVDLARDLVALPAFPSEEVPVGSRVPRGRMAGSLVHSHANGRPVPDLDDSATLGCLLALLPPGWRPDSNGEPNRPFRVRAHGRCWYGATLGEAVALALIGIGWCS